MPQHTLGESEASHGDIPAARSPAVVGPFGPARGYMPDASICLWPFTEVAAPAPRTCILEVDDMQLAHGLSRTAGAVAAADTRPLSLNFHLAMGAAAPWVISADPNDQGVDLDSLMTMLQAALAVVSLAYLVRLRGRPIA